MCTISWCFEKGTFNVFFNRDEQVSRPVATPPEILELDGAERNIMAIMPTDPQGGGTWLAVNDRGWIFALLNYYQGRRPKGKLASRGKIVKALAACVTKEQIDALLIRLDMSRYPPFSLLCFPPTLLNGEDKGMPKMNLLQWNGKLMESKAQTSPLFSSAVMFDDVCSVRKRQFADAIAHQAMSHTQQSLVDCLIGLHRSHEPTPSAYSICMHRDDAKTMSFSHISVAKTEVFFHYTDGPPCSDNKATRLCLKRDNI